MKLAVKLTGWLLKRDLSLEDRNALIIHILDSLAALPLRDIIKFDTDGSLTVNDRPLTFEQARSLRESARAALNNQALKLVHDAVLFKAIALGVHTVEKTEQMVFGRAAIWWGQQQDRIIRLLAQEDSELTPLA